MHTHHHDHHDHHDHDTHEGHAGPPPWVRAMRSGDGPPFRGRRGRPADSPGSFFGHGPRAARGDVRAAILTLLAEAPMHGYQVIQEITERSDGVWSPSPGSVYPTLQQLEDEDLVTSDSAGGKKVFSLTDAGRAAAEARGTSRAPWEEVGDDVAGTLLELRDGIRQVVGAVHQIARGGTATQVAAAKRVLADTRRALYRILAEDES